MGDGYLECDLPALEYEFANLTPEELGVLLGEICPFFGEIVESKDGGYGADGDTGAAIDALDWIDIEHLLAFELWFVFLGVDAIHRAGVDAGTILSSDTRFGDYVSHLSFD